MFYNLVCMQIESRDQSLSLYFCFIIEYPSYTDKGDINQSLVGTSVGYSYVQAVQTEFQKFSSRFLVQLFTLSNKKMVSGLCPVPMRKFPGVFQAP